MIRAQLQILDRLASLMGVHHECLIMLGEIAIVPGAGFHLPLRLSAVPIDKPVRSLRWLRRFCGGFRSATAARPAQEGLLRLAELVSCSLRCLLLSGKGAHVFTANHGLPWLGLLSGNQRLVTWWYFEAGITISSAG